MLHSGDRHVGKWAKTHEGDSASLENGSRVAVIGAGPAGSMFSYFLLHMAETIDLDVDVDIYEPRHFTHRGPAGCNHCGGVVSESLLQTLATDGINLPPGVIQRGMDSYMLHMDVGDAYIETPLHEMRIAAVYRGNGPRDSEPSDTESFDGYLANLATAQGARMVRRMVTDVQRHENRMRVICADGHTGEYDLVAVATGVNSRLLESVATSRIKLCVPKRMKTFICEFRLGRSLIREFLGTSMHVFLLDIPRLEFAALIPKGDYVTLVLLGDGIDDELISSFFGAEEVKRCFPGNTVPPHVCHCFPRINISAARRPFDDRLVMIGDSGATRLYKDGIGAAYRTAKAAARTAIFHGVSARNFADNYWPLCQRIEFDNRIGRLVFSIGALIQKTRFARRGVLRMTVAEQTKAKGRRRMSEILWDLFSGSAPYRDVFLRILHPAYVGPLLWNLVIGNLRPAPRERADGTEQGA